MIEEKIIPIHELKYYHGDSLGFVFRGVNPSSNEAIQRLAKNLIEWKVSDKLPEFFVRTSTNEVAFVFSGDSGFKQTVFFQASKQFNLFGIFKIDTLAGYLADKN
jgi:hypothetical protein